MAEVTSGSLVVVVMETWEADALATAVRYGIVTLRDSSEEVHQMMRRTATSILYDMGYEPM